MFESIAIIIVIAVFISLFYIWRWVLGRKLKNRNEDNLPAILLAFVTGIAVLFLLVTILMSGIQC